jgi:hypothetical protein
MRDSVLPKSANSFPASQQRRASHERWISLYPCIPVISGSKAKVPPHGSTLHESLTCPSQSLPAIFCQQ